MNKVKVAFLWHMHQPSYRDPLSKAMLLPWARLHALKDYWGMVAMLADWPDVHMTFNIVPSLIDQIESYLSGESNEILLALSIKPAAQLNEDEKLIALRGFFMAHPQNLIGRFPRFTELLERRGATHEERALQAAVPRFKEEDWRDLQVLGKLAWFDIDWARRDPVIKELNEKGRGYSEDDKARLAEREQAIMAAILPTYRRAAQSGQIEISTSPYYHPILPLLCDTEAHHEAHPGSPLPRRYQHPEDAADQIHRALVRHKEVFGATPQGMWPSEGSLSEEAVLEMAKAGIVWTASDEGVLERSINRPLHRDSRGTAYPMDVIYRPWQRTTAAGPVRLIFRDRALSDLIGFSYSHLEPERAAEDLLGRVRRIGERWRQNNFAGDPIVPIILDGENAWEYFRDGGRVFLRHVYRGLAEDPELCAMTMSEALADTEPAEVPRVFAGSWIHAEFSVWIGHADDRRAWDLLSNARDVLVEAEQRGIASARIEEAWTVFRAACGSDWCWWYGGDHASENDVEFDALFRRHLRAIYDLIELPSPEALGDPLITARAIEVRQSEPTGALDPILDGEISSASEWVAAGVYRVPFAGTAMHRGAEGIRTLRFGSGREHLWLLIETSPDTGKRLLEKQEMVIAFPGPTAWRYRLQMRADGAQLVREERTGIGWVEANTRAQAVAAQVIEICIPLEELRPDADRQIAFRILLIEGGLETERHPETGPLRFDLTAISRD